MKNLKILEQSIMELGILIENAKQIRKKLIEPLMPLTAYFVENCSLEERVIIDSLAMRYLQIQDMLSNKIFVRFLEVVDEDLVGMSFIDILNRLEKMNIIKNSYRFRHLRDLRNHLTHEYPDRPDMRADFLNQAYDGIPELIEIFDIIKVRLQAIKE